MQRCALIESRAATQNVVAGYVQLKGLNVVLAGPKMWVLGVSVELLSGVVELFPRHGGALTIRH